MPGFGQRLINVLSDIHADSDQAKKPVGRVFQILFRSFRHFRGIHQSRYASNRSGNTTVVYSFESVSKSPRERDNRYVLFLAPSRNTGRCFPKCRLSVQTITPEAGKVELKTVKAWNFVGTGPAVAKEWSFPGEKPELTPKGVAYVPREKSGPGPVIQGLKVDAAKVSEVRVHMALTNGGDAASLDRLRLFWARPNDIKEAKGKWALCRGAAGIVEARGQGFSERVEGDRGRPPGVERHH